MTKKQMYLNDKDTEAFYELLEQKKKKKRTHYKSSLQCKNTTKTAP